MVGKNVHMQLLSLMVKKKKLLVYFKIAMILLFCVLYIFSYTEFYSTSYM